MPLKIVLKNGEKIIINGAVLQNIGGAAKALVLNEAAVLREKDIITESEAQTPASRCYFALQNLYLFPGREEVYKPLVREFLTDYGNAAPSARKLVDDMLQAVDEGQSYRALRLARDLVAHEGSIFDHVKEQLSAELSDSPDGGEPPEDGGLGADGSSPEDEGNSSKRAV
jgi:flagellar protein FlbT